MFLSLWDNAKLIGKRNPYYVKYDVGFDENGKLAGIIMDAYVDCGATTMDSPIGAIGSFGDNCKACVMCLCEIAFLMQRSFVQDLTTISWQLICAPTGKWAWPNAGRICPPTPGHVLQVWRIEILRSLALFFICSSSRIFIIVYCIIFQNICFFLDIFSIGIQFELGADSKYH